MVILGVVCALLGLFGTVFSPTMPKECAWCGVRLVPGGTRKQETF